MICRPAAHGRALKSAGPMSRAKLSRAAHAAFGVVRYSGLRAKKNGELDAKVRRINAGIRGEFTAIIEAAPEGGFWAICREVPEANGQGESVDEARTSLRQAIRLIFEDRVDEAPRGLPEDPIQAVVAVSGNAASWRRRCVMPDASSSENAGRIHFGSILAQASSKRFRVTPRSKSQLRGRF